MPKVSTAVTGKLKALKIEQRNGPVWKGPHEDGITFSLLSRFLVCRERFRLLVVEGLKPADEFRPTIEFGQMWHACEEAFAANQPWSKVLAEYCKGLCTKYKLQGDQINHWYEVCKMMFPLYVEHWAQHDDVKDRTPLLQEQVFDVPYKLPSGRVVRLRGKWDSVDLIGKGKQAGVYIQENKTKSGIDEQRIRRQLGFDLQTMIYLVALETDQKLAFKNAPVNVDKRIFTSQVQGVRYNVIRRSAHKQGKKETMADFCERLKGIIVASPQEWFARWKVEIATHEVTKFRHEFLDPQLEQLCDWWEVIQDCNDPFNNASKSWTNSIHWRHPFGVYNVLDEGGSSDLDHYLETGDKTGLQEVARLFTELDPS